MRDTLAEDEFEGELEIFSFKVSEPRRRIYISVDAINDKFGSPTLDQLSAVSRAFNEKLEAKGFPDDVALEVASPGAERKLRLPGDLARFSELTMRVTYKDAEAEDGMTTKVLLMGGVRRGGWDGDVETGRRGGEPTAGEEGAGHEQETAGVARDRRVRGRRQGEPLHRSLTFL